MTVIGKIKTEKIWFLAIFTQCDVNHVRTPNLESISNDQNDFTKHIKKSKKFPLIRKVLRLQRTAKSF